ERAPAPKAASSYRGTARRRSPRGSPPGAALRWPPVAVGFWKRPSIAGGRVRVPVTLVGFRPAPCRCRKATTDRSGWDSRPLAAVVDGEPTPWVVEAIGATPS